MENKCRICGKKIGEHYTDRILFCWKCRKEVDKAIGYDREYIENTEDELFVWREQCRKLDKENKILKEENEQLKMIIDNLDESEYIFDSRKYDFMWLTSSTPQLKVSKKLESGSCFTKID